MASDARLIVCEKKGGWAAAFRRALPRQVVRVHEMRSLPECWDDLQKYPASFAALEASPTNLEPLLQMLTKLRRLPDVCPIVLGARALCEYEPLWREAGALHVAPSPRRLAPAVRMALRHLSRSPQPPAGPLEEIWNSLPWSDQEM